MTSSVAGINAVLARGVVISGHIRSATGATLAGSAFLADGNKPCCVFGVGHGTTSDGAYSFTVPPGNYFVGFYADGYKFQYWNGKTDPLLADVLPAAADRSGIDSSLAPIDSSPPAGSGPPTDGSPPGGSAPPSDGTLPAGSGPPTDGTPGASGAVADDRAIASIRPVWQRFDASWSVVVT
ncbi:MAG: hypothetical protein E6I18_10235 [Chloroflexi bacterium]|nr:MAG: hypothetical protein E6I18_10235 [Chloroflexota bacterium]